MDEYITNFTSLLRYVSYLREEKAKVQIFLSRFPTHMKERIEFVNPKTMDEAIRKARICYQNSKAKGEVGKSWQPRKGHKINSNFKGAKSNTFNNSARSFVSKKFGRNHQRTCSPAKEKPTEASSKPEQGQVTKPPLQCWGSGEAHYYKKFPQRTRNDTVPNVQETSTVGNLV